MLYLGIQSETIGVKTNVRIQRRVANDRWRLFYEGYCSLPFEIVRFEVFQLYIRVELD